jgi:hypothetical protein
MKTTLRQLDKALEAIATGMPLTVADYFWGDWRDSFTDRVQKYPAVVCNVSAPVGMTSRVTRMQLNVICVDQVTRDSKNLKDVESDTLQVLHDFVKVIRSSPNWRDFCVVESASAGIKFKDLSPDQVAGWQVTINLKLMETGGLCDIPLVDYDINKKINC